MLSKCANFASITFAVRKHTYALLCQLRVKIGAFEILLVNIVSYLLWEKLSFESFQGKYYALEKN